MSGEVSDLRATLAAAPLSTVGDHRGGPGSHMGTATEIAEAWCRQPTLGIRPGLVDTISGKQVVVAVKADDALLVDLIPERL